MIENNERTEYITHNGHRDIIEALQPVRDQLKNEGWTIGETRVYPDIEDTSRDYLTILIHKTFILKNL
jgi:hypothetical protein